MLTCHSQGPVPPAQVPRFFPDTGYGLGIAPHHHCQVRRHGLKPLFMIASVAGKEVQN